METAIIILISANVIVIIANYLAQMKINRSIKKHGNDILIYTI